MSAPRGGRPRSPGSFALRASVVVARGAAAGPAWLSVHDGVIESVVRSDRAPSALGEAPQIDADGLVAVPGFFDLHVHGADGAQVNGDSVEEVAASVDHISRFHARHGTTSWLATTVSDSGERLRTSVAGIAHAIRTGVGGATVRGVHLEGPWIARAKIGAQDPAALRLPDPAELRALCAIAPGTVRLVTLAPELPGAAQLAEAARECGAVVAIGHSDADFATAAAAFEAGARHVTHLFNAMAPLHHRRPGAVAAALLDDRVTLELIADGEHLHVAMLRLVARLAPGRLVAVSDAVAATGTSSGRYHLGDIEVEVSPRRVTLARDSGTLAGSLLTMDRAVHNLTASGMPLEEAVAAATITPARVAGYEGLGMLEAGAPADIALLDAESGCAVATVIDGRAVHDPLELFS